MKTRSFQNKRLLGRKIIIHRPLLCGTRARNRSNVRNSARPERYSIYIYFTLLSVYPEEAISQLQKRPGVLKNCRRKAARLLCCLKDACKQRWMSQTRHQYGLRPLVLEYPIFTQRFGKKGILTWILLWPGCVESW